MKRIMMTACMLGLGLSVGCSNQSETTEQEIKGQMAKEETAEAVQAVGEYAEASSEVVERELRELSDALDAKWDALREKSGETADDMRSELREKREMVAQALQKFEDASAEEWEQTKEGMRDVVSDVQAWLNEQHSL